MFFCLLRFSGRGCGLCASRIDFILNMIVIQDSKASKQTVQCSKNMGIRRRRNDITTLAFYGHGSEAILFFSMWQGK